MSDEKTNDEPSGASGGSIDEPVAWAVARESDGHIARVELFECTAERAVMQRGEGWVVVPLVRQRQQ